MKRSLARRLTKRAFDLAIAAPAVVVTAPIMAGVALALAKDIGTPVLFRHTRPGLHGEPFVLLKFRTMRDTRDASGALLPDADRLSRVGSVVRKLSLDELPQLLNVLKGEMSIVGPRPLLMEYLTRYSPEQARRHDVKPGITGWAQVNGRNAISWEQKFVFDVWYVDHESLALDVKILVKTAMKVLARSDISASGHATMPVFMGSPTTTDAEPEAMRAEARVAHG